MNRFSWLATALLVACGGDEPTKTDKPAQTEVVQTSTEEAVEVASPETEYVYNPIGKRDPFRTYITDIDEGEVTDPTPLQRYELEQYQLTGIIWGTERPRALMEDPEGMGHVVEIGTYVGKKWGKVTQITSNQLIVTEEYLTPDGALVVNPIEITMQTGEE